MDSRKFVEIQKPIEEVKYIENEVPSWEEFEKNWQADKNLNYSDLSGGDVGTRKGYGPCYDCGNTSLRFKLVIELRNWMGNIRHGEVCSVKEAERAAKEIEEERGFWEDRFFDTYSSSNRHRLANTIRTWIDYHKNGNSFDKELKVGDGY